MINLALGQRSENERPYWGHWIVQTNICHGQSKTKQLVIITHNLHDQTTKPPESAGMWAHSAPRYGY